MSNQLPTFKTKLFFWIILGSISTFFAEVIAGSFLFPFLPNIDAWGIISVIPLYTFHILTLGYIIYNYGKPRFHTLFIAGAIFGMYEAYATGVLWAGFNADGVVVSLFGLGIIEAIMLVLLWHPLMALIIPIVIGESTLTKTRESLVDVKKYTTKKFLIFLAIVFGLIQAFNISSPTLSLSAGLVNIPIIALLIYAWRKMNMNKYSMKELLPNKKQFYIIFVLMILQYIFLASLNSDKIPGLTSQSFVWLIYFILFYLLYRSLKKSKEKIQKIDAKFSWKLFTLLSIIFVVSSIIFSILLTPIRSAIWIFILLIYIVLGLIMFFYSLKKIFEKTKK